MTGGRNHGHQLRAHEDTLLTNHLLQAARVLLVEDEFLIAMDVEQVCRDHGAQDVRVVASHDDLNPALLTGFAFDVAILDIQVQGKWTIDFARLLTKHSVPFIFATGYSDMETLFRDFPGVPVVGKPYTSGDLIEALCAAMGAKAALAQDGCDNLERSVPD
jgi:CheY-like chemotaxis protein